MGSFMLILLTQGITESQIDLVPGAIRYSVGYLMDTQMDAVSQSHQPNCNSVTAVPM